MNTLVKIFLIYSVGYVCANLSSLAFAASVGGREIDVKILTPVTGWQNQSADIENLLQKYAGVVAKFENSPDRGILIEALAFLENNATKISNKNYLTLIDYKKNAESKRFYVIDLRTAEVSKYNVSNGRGSDVDHDGNAESFSNEFDSYKTSLGFYLTLDDYFSEKFESKALRLEGLSLTNSNALERAIVIHGAEYMDPEKGLFGRSLGCPALDKDVAPVVISEIKNGSLVFAYK